MRDNPESFVSLQAKSENGLHRSKEQALCIRFAPSYTTRGDSLRY